MIRKKWHYNSSAVKQYFQVSDYHKPVAGEWIGRDAAALGLTGQATEEDFDKVLNNINPLTGESLTRFTRDGRRVALELNFNAVKDPSIAWALGGEGNEGDPLAEWCHKEAVRYTLGFIERDMQARVRDGGKGDSTENRTTGRMLAWMTTHRETRVNPDDFTPDMDIHEHVLIMNETFDPVAKKWKAIEAGKIIGNLPLYEAIYHSRMAYLLRTVGQYGIERHGKAYRLVGLSRELRDLFSRRRKHIKAVAEELGITTPEGFDKLGATTRLGKTDMLDGELHDHWLGKLSEEQKRQLAALKGQPSAPCGAAQAVRYAIEHELYRQSVVSEARLYETAIRRGMGWVTSLDEVKEECRRQGVIIDKGQATTQERRGEEIFMSRMARDGKGRKRPVVADPEKLRQLLAAVRLPGGKEPSGEQLSALGGLLESRCVVNVLDAGQGTGKTTLLEWFAQVLDRYKVRSTWLGTTHTAVDELKEKGLPAMTVAHFLGSEEARRGAAGSRIIIDESSMLAHGDAYALFKYAQANGCRLDFVGDSKQYKSPAAGNTMGLLTRYAVEPITMTKTMRQTGRLKDAMEAIRDGEPLKGHDVLTELGMVQELPLGELTQKAADLYLKWSAAGKDVPVISPTHAQAAEIAARIRQGLRARGDLTGENRIVRRLVNLNWSPAQLADARKHGGGEGVVLTRYGAYREDTQLLAAGDLVKTTMGGKTKDGKRLRAGQKFRVKGFTRSGDVILEGGMVVDKDWGGLAQRYVGTGQGAQGITADRAIVVYGTPSLVATREEGFYVPVSRVRSRVAVLTDSNAALREAIQRQDRRKFALELSDPEREQAALAERLKNHMIFIRRQEVFARTHERPATAPQRTRDHDRGR